MEKFEKMDLSLSEILGIDNEYELLNKQAKVMLLTSDFISSIYYDSWRMGFKSCTIQCLIVAINLFIAYSQHRDIQSQYIADLVYANIGYLVILSSIFILLYYCIHVFLINKFYYRVRKKLKNGAPRKTCLK
jgi:hypothetical protein